MRRGILVLTITMALTASGGAVAQADTYCVPAHAGCVGLTRTTIALALSDASGTVTPDTIELIAGTYSESGLGYSVGTPSNTVTIQGAGRGSTIIRRNDVSTGNRVLDFNSGATVKDLTLRARANSTLLALGNADLNFDNVAFDTDPSTAPQFVQGVYGSGDTTITNSVFNLGSIVDDNPAECVYADSTANSLEITNSTLQNCGKAVYSYNEAPVSLERVRISFSGTAIEKYEGTLDVHDSLIDASIDAIIGSGGPIVLSPQSPGQVYDATFNQTTIVGPGGGATDTGISLTAGPTGSGGSLTLTDTIISGFDVELNCEDGPLGNSINISGHHVAYPGTTAALDSGNCYDLITNAYAAAPGFLGAGPDKFQLTASSPLRNADPTPLNLLVEPAVDLIGTPRLLEGARDIGAYEFVPPPAAGVAPAVVASFTGSFKFAKAKVKRKKAAKIAFTLSAPATVAFKLKAAKKKNKVPQLKSAAGKAGANTYSVSTKKLKAGKYTLTATLPSGTTKSAKLTVTK